MWSLLHGCMAGRPQPGRGEGSQPSDPSALSELRGGVEPLGSPRPHPGQVPPVPERRGGENTSGAPSRKELPTPGRSGAVSLEHPSAAGLRLSLSFHT